MEPDKLLLKGTEAHSYPKSADQVLLSLYGSKASSLPHLAGPSSPTAAPIWGIPRKQGKAEVSLRLLAPWPDSPSHMQACRAAFSWFPARPGHRAPPQEVRAVVRRCNRDGLTLPIQGNSPVFVSAQITFSHVHSPFAFCKGPYFTSQHRYRQKKIKSFPAAHIQP